MKEYQNLSKRRSSHLAGRLLTLSALSNILLFKYININILNLIFFVVLCLKLLRLMFLSTKTFNRTRSYFMKQEINVQFLLKISLGMNFLQKHQLENV